MKKRIDMDKFTQMYYDGATHPQLCEEFDLCPATIINKIKEYGLPPRRKPLSIDLEKFREAYAQGLSSRQLSAEFGICRNTVAKIVKELRLRENEINRAHGLHQETELYARI